MIVKIIVVILFIFLILYIIKLNTNNYISSQKKNELYRIMNVTDRILKENNIKYFITCGTLLGSVREKGIIPWDNDIDIGIFQEDFNKVLALKENFAKENLNLYMYEKDQILQLHSNVIDAHLDFFPYVLDDDNNTYIHYDKLNRERYPTEKFNKDELLPIKDTYTFGPLTNISGPNDGDKCLVHIFGPDWRTPINYGKNNNYFFF
jgi:hypothetical protein